jgi:integrase
MTVEDACNQYWEEKMTRVRSSDDQATNLEHLCRCLGPDTLLVEVTPAMVAQAAAMRARTPLVRYRKGTGSVEPTNLFPKPATVNRQIIEPVRRLLRYAKTTWKVPIDLEEFQWGELKYEEPAERVRELGEAEERRYWECLRPDYHPIIEMYLISGRRRSDWVMLSKFRVDLKAGRVRHTIHKRKEQGDLYVTLTAREREIIEQEMTKAPDCEYVFTYEVQYGPDKGKRRPINAYSLRSAHRYARERAGLPDFRIHDCRHTFATRLLRAKGNLKLVQRGLDHTDIASTTKYVQVLDQEVTDARSEIQASRNSPEAQNAGLKKESERS